MASYELYLIFLIYSGAIILSALACIWIMLSTSKPGKENGSHLVPPERNKVAESAQPGKLESIQEMTTPALEIERLVETTPLWKPKTSLEGSKVAILQAYYKAMSILERVTKIAMNPQMILRGFLKEITPLLNGAAEAFSKLTILAERVLYSRYTPGEDDVLRAQNLASQVEEEVKEKYKMSNNAECQNPNDRKTESFEF